MQSTSEQWLEGGRRAAPDAIEDPTNKAELAAILRVPLLPTSALYSGTQFVRCSADGKDTALVSARLDTCGYFLRVGSSKEGESAIDIRKLRVSRPTFFCMRPKMNEPLPICCNYACIWPYVCCSQLVIGGNKPKDSSKIKKLLGSDQVHNMFQFYAQCRFYTV